MPKAIMISNVVLLLCLSMLVGSGAMFLIAGTDDIAVDMGVVRWVNGVALVTAVVMLVTEVFSGIRLVPVFALLGLGAATYFSHDAEVMDFSALMGWVLAWIFVVFWFAYLAGRGRRSQ